VKVVKHKAEEGRVAIRNLRRAGRHELEELERDGELSSDDVERAEKELEKLTHEKVRRSTPFSPIKSGSCSNCEPEAYSHMAPPKCRAVRRSRSPGA